MTDDHSHVIHRALTRKERIVIVWTMSAQIEPKEAPPSSDKAHTIE